MRIFAFVEDYENSKRNFEEFAREVESLCKEKRISLYNNAIDRIDIPWDDSVNTQISVFLRMIDLIDNGDKIYACVTYSSKPAVIAELMVLRYARQLKKDVYVDYVVYGGLDFKTHEATIYDVTKLIEIDDFVCMSAEKGDPNLLGHVSTI